MEQDPRANGSLARRMLALPKTGLSSQSWKMVYRLATTPRGEGFRSKAALGAIHLACPSQKSRFTPSAERAILVPVAGSGAFIQLLSTGRYGPPIGGAFDAQTIWYGEPLCSDTMMVFDTSSIAASVFPTGCQLTVGSEECI